MRISDWSSDVCSSDLATERFRRLKAGSIGPDRLHRHVKRRCKMRKVRDFDSELKALNERTKLLQQRKVQQFGELVEAPEADAIDPDILAVALLAAVAEKDNTQLDNGRPPARDFFRAR